ncbi:MAG TPA: hypothetical protein VGN76_02360 [Gemmatimonadales bacterium]|nr:hypothetical protein [Gemmatimonadales bacterium]
MSSSQFREPGAARAGGYVLALASLLVVIGLIFHPVPAGGFEERPSVLSQTPWWGPIHVAIATGFVLCVLGGILMLAAGGRLLRPWISSLFWGAVVVGMIFFTGVALINGWVMHALTAAGAPQSDPLLYFAFNRLLIGYGWLGNPLFLVGLTGLAYLETRSPAPFVSRPVAWLGFVASILSWGRGIGSATGWYFLEPLIYANVPAFLWLGYYGLRIANEARRGATVTKP